MLALGGVAFREGFTVKLSRKKKEIISRLILLRRYSQFDKYENDITTTDYKSINHLGPFDRTNV